MLLVERKKRKAHRKSRLGCANCKKRRIKCDEQKPACTNCINHSIDCDFKTSVLTPSATPGGPQLCPPLEPPFPVSTPLLPGGDTTHTPAFTNNNNPAPQLDLSDLELLHHYTTSAYHRMTHGQVLETLWRVTVPEVGFKHHYVMHGILAFSAIDLANQHPSRGSQYRAQGHRHRDAGMRLASLQLAHITPENSHAVYIFATIMAMNGMRAGPQPGEYLLFGVHGVAEWLVLFHGVKSIFFTASDALNNSCIRPLFRVGSRMSEIRAATAALPEDEHIQALRDMLGEALAARPPCVDALADLSLSYKAIKRSERPQHESQFVFIWLYRLEDDFIALVHAHDPVALAIFAYFCLLITPLTTTWCCDGWAPHLVSGIYHFMDQRYRPWLAWPMQQAGWFPS